MFKFEFENDYLLSYLRLCDSCLSRDEVEIGECHHVFPRAIFGNNDYTVKMTYQEHFKAHWYLCKAYEEAGLKRPFMQMAKALFSFVGIADYRRSIIDNFTEEEIDELAPLIAEAREYNRISSIGELNGFYGKTHSPESAAKMSSARKGKVLSEETRGKISRYMSTRDKNFVRYYPHHDITTKENFYFSMNDIKMGLVPENFVRGRYITEKERLKRSLAMKQASDNFDYHWVKRGKDSELYESKHAYNPMTGDRIRILLGQEIPEGWVYGMVQDDEWKQKRIAASRAKIKGVKNDYTANVINKDPEKIRKTAEKHRGMKRSDAARKNISEAIKKAYQEKGSKRNGAKKYFDLINRKVIFLHPEQYEMRPDKENLTDEQMIRIRNIETGSITYKTMKEEMPVGYEIVNKNKYC
jgi:hypothetical protein